MAAFGSSCSMSIKSRSLSSSFSFRSHIQPLSCCKAGGHPSGPSSTTCTRDRGAGTADATQTSGCPSSSRDAANCGACTEPMAADQRTSGCRLRLTERTATGLSVSSSSKDVRRGSLESLPMSRPTRTRCKCTWSRRTRITTVSARAAGPDPECGESPYTYALQRTPLLSCSSNVVYLRKRSRGHAVFSTTRRFVR